VVKVIWHKATLPQAHRWFNRIRQVAPMCNFMRYTLPWTQSSPHSKWHLDQFSHFCTAHGRQSLYFTMGCSFSPSKLPLHMRGSVPHWIHRSLNSPHSACQMTAQLVQPFCSAHDRDRPSDRQTRPTHRPCYSICNNRLHLGSTTKWLSTVHKTIPLQGIKN